MVGGTIATGGTLLVLIIIGFPEVEGAEGVLGAGTILGLASAAGDAPLVAVSAGAYGALVGTEVGIAATPPTCAGQAPPGNGS